MSSVREELVTDTLPDTFAIGIVGAGWIASAYHLPILHTLDGANVTFVADIDRERARKVCRGYGAEPVAVGDDPAVLPSCDVLVLAIPVGVRSAYISEFADRDTAIFSEKPFAIDTDMHATFLRMTDTISCNYMRRHYNTTKQFCHIIRSDMFGELESVELVEEGKTGATGLSKDHFQTDPKKGGGGILMERGCHSLSQLCAIFEGCEFSVVDADIVSHDGIDAEVTAVLEVERDSSVVEIDYHISRINPVGSKLAFEFADERLEADPYDPESRVSLHSRTEESPTDALAFVPDQTAATSTQQAIYRQWKSFLSRLTVENIDSEAETMPLVTELIADIYEVAGEEGE